MTADTAKLYVGNISYETTQDDLYDLFGRYGHVEDAFVPTDRDTGAPRGFGFVTMSATEAHAAINGLDNTEFMGRSIRVNEAQPKNEGGGGGRDFGGGGRGGGGFRGGGGGGGYGNRNGGGGGYGNRGGGGYGGGGGGYGGGGGGGYRGGGGRY